MISAELLQKLYAIQEAAEKVIQHQCRIDDGLDDPYYTLAVALESYQMDLEDASR